MNRLGRSLTYFAAALLGASLITAPPVQAAGPGALLDGLKRFQGGVGTTDRSLSVAPQVGWNAGLESVRPPSAPWYRLWDMKVAWRDVNPAPGVFDWSILDRRITQVESWGGRPLLVLGLTPQWAAADPSAGDPRWGAGSASLPADLDTWTDYVRAVAARYGDRIGAYEIWNEANLRTFWAGTPEQMALLTALANQEIKKFSPNATVLAPSVTTRLKSGARFSARFLSEFGPNPPSFDAWAIHSYPAGDAGVSFDGSCDADPATGQTPDDCVAGKSTRLAAQQRAADIRQWQQAVVAAAVAISQSALDLPIWDTEVNYGLAGPGIIPGVDWSSEQGARLMAYTLGDSALLGIDNTFWYQFTATPYSLLGVQMTPSTPGTLSAWTAGSAIPSVDGSQEFPVINGCRYTFQLMCPNADLKQADLSFSLLDRSNLDNADLYRANLSGSRIRDSRAVGARFLRADLNGLIAARSKFSRSNMKGVTATRAIFDGADLRDVDFRNADLRNAKFIGADLREADLRNADLRGVDFANANLEGANLRGAQTSGASFKRAQMAGARL